MNRGILRRLQHQGRYHRLPELKSGLVAEGKLVPRDDDRVLPGLPVLLGPVSPAVGRVVLDPQSMQLLWSSAHHAPASDIHHRVLLPCRQLVPGRLGLSQRLLQDLGRRVEDPCENCLRHFNALPYTTNARSRCQQVNSVCSPLEDWWNRQFPPGTFRLRSLSCGHSHAWAGGADTYCSTPMWSARSSWLTSTPPAVPAWRELPRPGHRCRIGQPGAGAGRPTAGPVDR